MYGFSANSITIHSFTFDERDIQASTLEDDREGATGNAATHDGNIDCLRARVWGL